MKSTDGRTPWVRVIPTNPCPLPKKKIQEKTKTQEKKTKKKTAPRFPRNHPSSRNNT